MTVVIFERIEIERGICRTHPVTVGYSQFKECVRWSERCLPEIQCVCDHYRIFGWSYGHLDALFWSSRRTAACSHIALLQLSTVQ
jgi:hypothetical protein